MPVNEHGQPVGDTVPGWTPPPAPEPVVLEGRWVRLEPLASEHAAGLFEASRDDALWTYLGSGRPGTAEAFDAYVEARVADPDLASFALLPRGGTAAGVASLMRADPANGVVEVGAILLGTPLQRTTAATEAMWLLARHAFALGYRRYEWKCDALNAPSRTAARRLGFRFEGVFRQAVVTKGRNRDTAWFAITDSDWAALVPAYQRWLDPANFDDPATGTGQRSSLSALTRTDAGTAFPHDGTRGTLA